MLRLGIEKDRTAFDAFALLIERSVSAAPIIDENGVLLGAISGRDTRRVVGQHAAKELAKPIVNFLEEIRGSNLV